MKKLLLLLMLASPVMADTGITLYDTVGKKYQEFPPAVLGKSYVVVVPLNPGTTNQVLSIVSVASNVVTTTWTTGIPGSVAWGAITGTLSNQNDLQAILTGLAVATGTITPNLLASTNTWTGGENFTRTVTISSGLIANGSAGNLGQILASGGPNTVPSFIDPIVSQSTDSNLNASVSIKGSSNTVTVALSSTGVNASTVAAAQIGQWSVSPGTGTQPVEFTSPPTVLLSSTGVNASTLAVVIIGGAAGGGAAQYNNTAGSLVTPSYQGVISSFPVNATNFPSGLTATGNALDVNNKSGGVTISNWVSTASVVISNWVTTQSVTVSNIVTTATVTQGGAFTVNYGTNPFVTISSAEAIAVQTGPGVTTAVGYQVGGTSVPVNVLNTISVNNHGVSVSNWVSTASVSVSNWVSTASVTVSNWVSTGSFVSTSAVAFASATVSTVGIPPGFAYMTMTTTSTLRTDLSTMGGAALVLNGDGGIPVHTTNGAAGGTSSNYGAAFPSAGTAAGWVNSSGNMQANRVDASSSAYTNTNEVAGSGVQTANPGEQVVSCDIRGTSNTVAATFSGAIAISNWVSTGTTVLISSQGVSASTIAAAQSGTWGVGITNWVSTVTATQGGAYTVNYGTNPFVVLSSADAMAVQTGPGVITGVGYQTGGTSVPVNVLNTLNVNNHGVTVSNWVSTASVVVSNWVTTGTIVVSTSDAISVQNGPGVVTPVGYQTGGSSVPVSVLNFPATQGVVVSNWVSSTNVSQVGGNTVQTANSGEQVVSVDIRGSSNTVSATLAVSTLTVNDATTANVVGYISSTNTVVAASSTWWYSMADFTIVPGTWTGIYVFEVSPDTGVSWLPIPATRMSSQISVSSYTQNVSYDTSTWQVNIAGMTNFRVRAAQSNAGPGLASTCTIVVQAMPFNPLQVNTLAVQISSNGNTAAWPVGYVANGSSVPVNVLNTLTVNNHGVTVSNWVSTVTATQGGAYTVNYGTNPFMMVSSADAISIQNGSGVGTPVGYQAGGSSLPVSGLLSDNGVAAIANRLGTTDGIYQNNYLNGTAATQGRNAAQSIGTEGLLWTAQLPAMRPASFSASTGTIVPASNATYIAALCGNANNTVLLYSIRASCTETTAGSVPFSIVRSTMQFIGTYSTATTVADDYTDMNVGQSSMTWFLANPTNTGLSVNSGNLDNYKLNCQATGTAAPNDIYISPADWRMKPKVLKGTNQCVAISLNSTTVTGGSFTATFDWLETTTISP
jgi:hypothetical protein